jgi:hypothetical protein
MASLKQGYLTKDPIRPSIFSHPRKRYFTLTARVLDWADDERSPNKDSMPLDDAKVEKAANALIIVRQNLRLVLRGEGLEDWEVAVRTAIDQIARSERERTECEARTEAAEEQAAVAVTELMDAKAMFEAQVQETQSAAARGLAAARERTEAAERRAAAAIESMAAMTTKTARGSMGWTAAKWLAGLGIAEIIADVLVPVDEEDQLEAISALGRKGGDLRAVIRGVMEGAKDAIVEVIATALDDLTSPGAITPDLLQAKFLQEGTGLLNYGDLNTFFGGLEAKLKEAPSPRVLETMAAEHTAREDSHEPFTTGNYGVTTMSATEWGFVAEPESRPADAWPVEASLSGPDSHKRRSPMPLAELQLHVAERGLQLEKRNEPPLTFAEGIGARLYTGPLFVKYNAVLRGLDSDVRFLENDMIERCCSKPTAVAYRGGLLPYARVRKELNTYATTLFAINSAIVKLGKLTVAHKVYRGIHGRVLPDQFWTANEFNVKGGIEGAFMSTTVERDVAMSYAAGAGGGAGLVFEIQQGMIDRGADIAFLSQYPFEREILVRARVHQGVWDGRRGLGPVLAGEGGCGSACDAWPPKARLHTHVHPCIAH